MSSYATIKFFNERLEPSYKQLKDFGIIDNSNAQGFLFLAEKFLGTANEYYNSLPYYNSCSTTLQSVHNHTWKAMRSASALYLNTLICFGLKPIQANLLPKFLQGQLSEQDVELLQDAQRNFKFGNANKLIQTILRISNNRTLYILFSALVLFCFSLALPLHVSPLILVVVNTFLILGSYFLLLHYSNWFYDKHILPARARGPNAIRKVLNLTEDDFDCAFE